MDEIEGLREIIKELTVSNDNLKALIEDLRGQLKDQEILRKSPSYGEAVSYAKIMEGLK